MPRDYGDDPFTDRREPGASRRAEAPPPDMIDMLGRRIGGAIVLAGALIGAGIYMSSDRVETPTYQAFAADGEVFRVNMESGTIIACNAERCMRVLQRGQDLEEDQQNTLFRTPAAQVAPAPQAPAPQLPAPTPAPEQQPE